ncbi:MAG: phosphate ABC transporter substrate-binding protein PstS [Ilumatobacter sp.]|uniref:phosphate ABC transporter substrate-binding protein PstS n=1 Tax=Ilumatobacter sp. TaxID=1967498 RepID=UPI003752B910|nr:phosphate ABC transporter substrate-binding protein PstS [Ilumatobacter sp.]
MNSPKRRRTQRLLAGALALTLVAAACGSDGDTATEPADDSTDESADSGAATETVGGTLVGAGSSAQAAGMQGWQAGFQALNPDATVEYDAIGSGGGRELFLAGGSSFAGSDAFLKDDEFEASKERCAGDQGAINIPHYISPIAIPYNLPQIEGSTLNLTPELIAGIFANELTNWNDPAIAALNEGVQFPDLPINPVHRSDESGTTENFTDYLAQSAPEVWTFGAIEVWDGDGPGRGEGAQGTSGVVAATAAGEGSIGYADASQIGDLPAAAVGVGGEFREFSPEAAGRIVDASERLDGRNEFDFAIEVNRTPESADVYPIALVSYHIVCLQYPDQETVDLVQAFMTYVGSEAGQEASTASAGSAPISAEVRADILTSIDAISVAG